MIRIENMVLPSPEQMRMIIRGMRNPMNSWDNGDSDFSPDLIDLEFMEGNNAIGDADYKLMYKLANAGSEHRKYLRMMNIYVDITAPLYWWKEFDTYKVGTVANSCSTMHKITERDFTVEDFSHEHLDDYYDGCSLHYLLMTLSLLNQCRSEYVKTKEKKYWWQIIQLLPSSYNQKRTVMLNYEVIGNIYHQRKNHKLDEWHEFCCWVEELPYRRLIAGFGRREHDQKVSKQILAEISGLPEDSSISEMAKAIIFGKED